MNFENESYQSNLPTSSTNNQNFLSGLVQTIGNDFINYGSHYLEQKFDQSTNNL